MAGFFKKLFGGGNDAEDIVQGMLDRSQNWQIIGAEIAQDCLTNGLSKGEIVKLSDISAFINKTIHTTVTLLKMDFLTK